MTDDTEATALTSPAVAHLCEAVLTVRRGLEALGVQAHLLDHVRKKLLTLDRTARLYEETDCFEAGRKAGWAAAFETGLVGDGDPQPAAEVELFRHGTFNMVGPVNEGDWVRFSDYQALAKAKGVQP